MKVFVKHLAFVALALLATAGGSVFAQSATTLTVSGKVTANTCTLRIYDSASATSVVPATGIVLPVISTTDISGSGTAAGVVTVNNAGVPVVFKAQKSDGTACNTDSTGGKFNVSITATSDANSASKAKNAATTGAATGVTIDLVPVSVTGVSATGNGGLDVRSTIPSTNHGLSDVVSTGYLEFRAKWYKTGATVAAGQVTVPFTVTMTVM